ncbi:uncharacterized protein LOC104908998 [Beta vulgaris subsp. vulgaris]|uniref:uncharacterized protein LOC104908998 n=1 Tax=Beta vulgaris subsp. vulgaris TaxID=3555 RepID=UPI00053FFB55|nr:uncharacterized protein LOC104908998 [Beta vulgaris subsp. vulgaris]
MGVNGIELLREHILRNGFRLEYHVWIWHGEEGVYEGNSCANDVHEQEHTSEEMEYDTEDEIDDDDNDHVDEMMDGVEDYLGQHSHVFESLTEGNWTDIIFTSLLELLSEMFPDGNELPKSTYYARKLLCPFGLEYKKKHACPNDCVLYRNEYDNLDECPRCGKSRYKRKGAGGSKGPPAKLLWVSVFDAHANEMFTLRAMLFCTINDFTAYDNLFGYKNKGKKACPICMDDMESTFIPNCKHVYMPYRKFLRPDHPFRKKKKAFYGSVEEGVARRPLTGKEVYEQLKGVETIFGKTMKEKKGF